MTLWFTSDEHYGHSQIIDYCERPFNDLMEMHSELIRRHNAVVSADDTVYHVGDFAFSIKLIEQVLPVLNGSHVLVPGNHDACHPCHSAHAAKAQRYTNAGFEISPVGGTDIILERDGKIEAVELNHFPFIPLDERYPEWLPSDNGQWLIHGHIHNRDGGWTVRDRMINVGVDVWDYEPVSEEQIKAIIFAAV
jgi:calcineurin-like phosphoesterase family protein